MIAIFMILMLTLRHDYVGTDTQNYRWTYKTLTGMSLENALEYNSDKGFVLFFQLMANLGFDFQVVLFIQAILYIGSVTILIKKYSQIPAMSFYLFMTFGYFIFATTMRQSIAMSFTLLAFDQIKKKKMILFISYVLIASTFHMSGLIFLPAYWVNKFKLNKKSISIIILMVLATLIFKDEIGSFILAYNKNDYSTTETGGYLLTVFFGVLLIGGIVYKKRFINNNGDNKMLFFMIAATLVVIPISKLNPALFRLVNYYQIFMILYIPNLIASIKDKGLRLLLIYVIFILGLFYFYYKLGSYGIRMHPYVFYWDQYPENLIPIGLMPIV